MRNEDSDLSVYLHANDQTEAESKAKVLYDDYLLSKGPFTCVNCNRVIDDSSQMIGIAPPGKSYPRCYLCLNCYNSHEKSEPKHEPVKAGLNRGISFLPEITYVVVERVQYGDQFAHVVLKTFSTQEDAEEFKLYYKKQYNVDAIIIHEIQNSV